ncbi:cyclopropane-fatty-acyl-phospholipid synthase [Acidocella aquatica]|uniref:Cyclopropane-fatty-acyl-phospholipid synthase n=1 Tax=Acidocella aquatica TaxID=1922313 RepID=A0ABQ6AA61_9PROT|nr:cyclopropane-fatty-acyl-phospholipid synthase family protein [Acidocella aquatica]GLR67019.1 cyclopropane-fatty-acyl-phospholipid synthase [Acidocella aquatica]
MSESPAVSAGFTSRLSDKKLELGLQLGRVLRAGSLTLELPGGGVHRFHGTEPGPAAKLVIHDSRTITKTMFGGSLGFSEAYLKGWWDSPNITDMLLLGAANEASWDALISGKPLMRLISRLIHSLRPNSRSGSKRNIADHYDLGNDFYQLWLDPTMTYSAALFEDGSASLEEAQRAKIRRVCKQLRLAPGQRLLEIGCGWGGFAQIAAAEFGAEVVGITLSREQLAHGQERIAKAGLGDRVNLQLLDYRDVQGNFDAIASVEMIEAVGQDYWPVYFRTLQERLKPGGLACIQAITIADRYFDEYRKSADFIQRYVFPGGMLLSPSKLRAQATSAGLLWRDAHWFGTDYAETLKQWQASFQASWPNIAKLSTAKGHYDARFKRLWEYYLAYCEAGFRAGWTDVGQILMARP